MKKILRKLLNNWPIKLFSIVAAFFLWLLVMIIENPEDQKSFYNIPVKLVNTEVLTDENMVYEILDKTNVVPRVTVTAKKTIRDDLSTADIVAEADFSKLTVANTVEIKFYSLRYNDEISAITGSNAILKLNIEDKKTKRLSLEVNTTGTVQEGYIIQSVTPDQNRIEVSGPESVISRITSAKVSIDVTDSVGNISTYADVILYDADGEQISTENLNMNTDSVRVKVEILATKMVPLHFSVMGMPGAGYLFTGEITSDPEKVLIAGTTEALLTVGEIVIPEEALNITGQTENMIVNVDIRDYLPQGIVLADPSFRGKASVVVHVEKEASKEIEVSADRIRILGVPAGYTVENTDEVLSYFLGIKGLQTELDAVNAEGLYGQINMTTFAAAQGWENLNTGVYEAEVSFGFPESIVVTRPVKIRVRITKTDEG